MDDGDFCEGLVFPEKLSIAEGRGSHPMQSLAGHQVAPSEWWLCIVQSVPIRALAQSTVAFKLPVVSH